MIDEKIINKIDRHLKTRGKNRTANYEHFFNSLSKPDWIIPLYNKKYFKKAPSIKSENDLIITPNWPESQYLIRMSPYEGEIAEAVQSIIENIDTDNDRVHEDMVNIAMGLPIRRIKNWLNKEIKWMEEKDHIYGRLSEKYSFLIIHLVKNGKSEQGLKVLQNLLKLSPNGEKHQNPTRVESDFNFPEPKTKIDQYHYEQILKKVTPVLVEEKPKETFELLCQLLNDSINFSRRNTEKEPDDYSYVWRAKLETEEYPYDIEHHLIDALRECGTIILKKSQVNIDWIVETLEHYQWHILKRFAMHFLREFPDDATDLIETYLSDKELIYKHCFTREWSLLIKQEFKNLSNDTKKKVFQLIERAPDLDDPSYLEYWQRDKLSAFHEDLPENWKMKYEELVITCGGESHLGSEFTEIQTSSWVGPKSPKSVEDLKQMTVPDIIQHMRDWEYTGENESPSPEGYSRIIEMDIRERPNEWIKHSKDFESFENKKTFIRQFFNGIRSSLNEKHEVNWELVLELSKWVVDHDRLVENDKIIKFSNHDPSWRNTRKAIVSLIGGVLEKDLIKLEYKNLVWEIIEHINLDPDPKLKDDGKTTSDSLTQSINCVRGEAMHTTIKYGLWLKRQLNKEKFSFKDCPKLKAVLEHRLKNDIYPAVRAVYGYWFPWIHLMDRNWAKNNVQNIFPVENEIIWTSAWEAYIKYRQPYNEVIKLLKPVYKKAIDKYGIESRQDLSKSARQLARHLTVYYWRGLLGLKEKDSLIQYFFLNSSDNLRKEAISYIGFSLAETKGDVEEKFIKRIKRLFIWRIKWIKENEDLNDYRLEVSGFSTWFFSGKIKDSKWLFRNLKNAIRYSDELMRRENVFRQLIQYVDKHPGVVLEFSKMMIDQGNIEHWAWKEHLLSIFEKIINSGNKRYIKKAMALMDTLGNMGYSNDFREMWEQANEKV